jgi:hypothetical protein
LQNWLALDVQAQAQADDAGGACPMGEMVDTGIRTALATTGCHRGRTVAPNPDWSSPRQSGCRMNVIASNVDTP